MVLIIDKKDLNKLISVSMKLKYKPKILGCIAKKNSNKAIVYEKELKQLFLFLEMAPIY